MFSFLNHLNTFLFGPGSSLPPRPDPLLATTVSLPPPPYRTYAEPDQPYAEPDQPYFEPDQPYFEPDRPYFHLDQAALELYREFSEPYEPNVVFPVAAGQREDTPRNRFVYNVQVRKAQLLQEWTRCRIRQDFLGDLESQEKVARDWVVSRWKERDIWKSTWSEDGPGAHERWSSGLSQGVPPSLLSIELEDELEHQLWMQRPPILPDVTSAIWASGHNNGPLEWNFSLLGYTALVVVFDRWEQEGFPAPSPERPSSRFHNSLERLYASLPEPARKELAPRNLETWDDLCEAGKKYRRAQACRSHYPLEDGSLFSTQEISTCAVGAVGVESSNHQEDNQKGSRENPEENRDTQEGNQEHQGHSQGNRGANQENQGGSHEDAAHARNRRSNNTRGGGQRRRSTRTRRGSHHPQRVNKPRRRNRR